MSAELLIAVLRPDRTLIYLPEDLAVQLRVRQRDALTAQQYAGKPVQDLIQKRLAAQGARKAAQ